MVSRAIALDLESDKTDPRAKALTLRPTVHGMKKLRAKGDRTKAIPARYAEPFRRKLAQVVREQYGDNQTRAEEGLGFTQSHISALINGRRSLGLAVLLELYEQTGITPNEWLGLEAPASKGTAADSHLVSAVVSGVADLLARRNGKKDDPEDSAPSTPPRDPDRVRRGLQRR